MIEAEFFLELLMRPLTDPSGFDRSGERFQVRVGRQVRHSVSLLACRSAFADKPDLVATLVQCFTDNVQADESGVMSAVCDRRSDGWREKATLSASLASCFRRLAACF